MERLISFLPILLLAALAAITYWLDKTVLGPAAPAEKRITHNPDFTADNLLATRMDVNGRIIDTLQAVRMVHFPEDDSTELARPRYVNLARGVPLTITSKHARVTSNAGDIYFHDDVRATRVVQGLGGPLVVLTDYLHVLPDDNIAKTDRRVTISDNHMRIEAVGMEMNTETRILNLKAAVNGVYHDPKTVASRPATQR
ncbi:MAG: LPS export ABC transporter periplasmic protein LptC [Betaproteobacteria bacterium]|nr:LPS export ABC transporter periplasmic protein LptC [Betaproteobacteria bacterium]